jgi:serpin B
MRHGTLAVALMLGLQIGCGEDPTNSPDVAQSDKQRITSPNVSSEDLAKLASGNTAFAMDLHRQLGSSSGNLFYSPYSISIALAMTYGGAVGATEQEMSQTMHYGLGQAALHPAFNALDLALASRGQGAKGKDGGKFRLNIANATWGQRGYSFLPTYLDLLAQNYGAGMRLVNFVDQPEPARVTINDWVAKATEDRIKDLIPQGAIDAMTRLVLTNAIYFNAAWRDKFDTAATKDGEFTTDDGSKVKVSMMNKLDSAFRYGKAEGCEAVEVGYDGDELSMVFLLPDGRLPTFEGALSGDKLEKILNSLGSAEVDLTVPKFKLEGTFKLAEVLDKLGMKTPFIGGKADFSGMDGQPGFLYISEVIHKSFIAIDEAGTEAAAATAVIMAGSAAPAQTKVVKLDRPFLFLIRDIKTNAVLFVGRVATPKA